MAPVYDHGANQLWNHYLVLSSSREVVRMHNCNLEYGFQGCRIRNSSGGYGIGAEAGSSGLLCSRCSTQHFITINAPPLRDSRVVASINNHPPYWICLLQVQTRLWLQTAYWAPPIDGGGIRTVLELLILHEIMSKIRYDLALPDISRPCD